MVLFILMLVLLVSWLGMLVGLTADIRHVKKSLRRIEHAVIPRPAVRLELYVKNGEVFERAINVQQKATETKTYKLRAVDAKGNEAKLDTKAPPVWAVSDPALANVTASTDGLTADVVPVGPVGEFELQVSGDADLGDGETPIQGTGDVEIIPGDAVSIEISQA